MIYELRAYIGKAGQLYTAIFTNMEAAQKKAAKLRKVCAVDNVQLFGTIKVLTPNGDTYEPNEELTQNI